MLRGSAESQARVLGLIGCAVVICVVLAAVVVVTNPFGGRPSDRFSIAIDTPYVGQGVETGSAIVMHGVKVGEVTGVALSSDGGARLEADLQKRPVAGLTDSMNIDFRPINYFGVPGINVLPNPGGTALRDGSEISLVPKGNFTLSELLSQFGDVSASAITPRLIAVADRVTRYTDGLNPLFETLLITTTAVADVQTAPTTTLLANTAAVSAAFPDFADAAIDAGTRTTSLNYPNYPAPGSAIPPETTGPKLTPPYLTGVRTPDLSDESEEYFDNAYREFLKITSGGLFASVGRLEGTHVDDLLPLINGIKGLTDTVPALLRPEDIARTLAEVRSRFETLYQGNGEQRALQVRVLLDSLPGVAAPLGVLGAPPELAPAPLEGSPG